MPLNIGGPCCASSSDPTTGGLAFAEEAVPGRLESEMAEPGSSMPQMRSLIAALPLLAAVPGALAGERAAENGSVETRSKIFTMGDYSRPAIAR